MGISFAPFAFIQRIISSRNFDLIHRYWLVHLPRSCIKLAHQHSVVNKTKYFNSRTPCPAIVEPLEHFDDEDGMPEKLVPKIPKYYK